MKMIPKYRLIYRIDVFRQGVRKPFDRVYCKPENLKYWLNGEIDENGVFWTVNNLLCTSQRWAELFSVSLNQP